MGSLMNHKKVYVEAKFLTKNLPKASVQFPTLYLSTFSLSMISSIKLGRTGLKLRYRYQHWSEDFQHDFHVFNISWFNQIAGDVTEKRPCGRMVAPIHQCCTFLAAFEAYHDNEHRAKNVSSQCNQYVCFALHVASKSIPYGRRPLPFDIICVHWPTFSSGQDSLKDSFGVRLL